MKLSPAYLAMAFMALIAFATTPAYAQQSGWKVVRLSLDYLQPNNHRWSMSVWRRGSIATDVIKCTRWGSYGKNIRRCCVGGSMSRNIDRQCHGERRVF